MRRLPSVGVQLPTRSGPLPPADDVAEALSNAAAHLGHRPALTVLRSDRRDEQGFRSLAKWASKGAHLLEIELGLGPGGRLRLDGPAGWPATTVCFAAWWVGVAVVDGSADVTVVHEPAGDVEGDAYAIGDEVDGSPTRPTTLEPWSVAVQTFPDQPPAPRGGPDDRAVEVTAAQLSQRELLDRARTWNDEDVVGVDASAPIATWLPAIVRPLVCGRRTVLVADGDRAAGDAEGVTLWV